MTAVTGVDNRNTGYGCGYHRSSFLGMTHGTDIRIAGNDPDGIGYAFPFGGGGTGGVGKAQYTASEIQHGGFKAEPGPGAGFVKAGGQLFTFTGMGICLLYTSSGEEER